MSQPKSEVIRKFVIDQVDKHPVDIARIAADYFGITRQAVRRHLITLIEDGILTAEGETRSRRYALVIAQRMWELPLAENQDEDKVWRDLLQTQMASYPENIQRICYYGFTEMFNNAIDHSNGTKATVLLECSAKQIRIFILDDGLGIFEKLRAAFGHEDYRQTFLELSKGKLTTDPTRHTGQGIFFTSRVFDFFSVVANSHAYARKTNSVNYILEQQTTKPGTTVCMEISVNTKRTLREIFDLYTNLDDEDYPFSKTHIPLGLARYGNEQLVSRSQAKRVLARFDQFEEVMLDFEGIDEIGQAFADEIFRVFRRGNPGVKILHINANERVQKMIRRAEATPIDPPSG